MVAATQTATNALQALQQTGWQFTRTSSNPRRAFEGPCPVGRHKNDHDSPAFSFTQDGQAFRCFKCDFQGYGPHQMLAKLGEGPTARALTPAPVMPSPKPQAKAKPMAKNSFQGATLDALAKSKGLDPDYLAQLGWRNTTHRRVPAVSMPYYDQQGQELIVKYRVGVDKGLKTLWPKGTSISPFGLQELPYAREHGFIILEEGETDWATLNYHGFPALGLPGVHAWKGEWLTYTNGIKRVYVWEESGGKPNQQGLTPGQQMVKRIADSQGEVWVIKAPEGAKDATELAALAGVDFADRMQELIDNAERYQGEGYTAPGSTVPISTSEAPGTQHRAPWKIVESCGHIHLGLQKWSERMGKPLNLTTLVYKHQLHVYELYPNDAEFCHLQEGAKLRIAYPDTMTGDSCIALENPALHMGHERLYNLVTAALGVVNINGEEVPATRRVSECGKEASMNCPVDGPQYNFKNSCRSPFCPTCNTKQSSRLAKLQLPDKAAGEGVYTEYWIETRHQLPEDRMHWEGQLSKLLNTWENGVGNVTRRKLYKKTGRILYRAHATYYTEDEAQTHWKLMAEERFEGEALEFIEELGVKLGGGGTVSSQRCYTNGQQGATQLVADTMTHFVGIAPETPFAAQVEIFRAHYQATKGRHIFQGLGNVYKLLQNIKRDDPPKCEICGRKLEQVLTDSNPEHLPNGTASGIVHPKHQHYKHCA